MKLLVLNFSKITKVCRLSMFLVPVALCSVPLACLGGTEPGIPNEQPNNVHQLKIQKFDGGIQSETRIKRPMSTGASANDTGASENAPLAGIATSSLQNGRIDRSDNSASLKSDTAQTDQSNQSFKLNTQTLRGAAEDTGTPVLDVPSMSVKLLSKYQIELIVDRSNSMRKQDCPGDLSRWAWCGQQAQGLAKAIAPFVPNGFTMTAFAWKFDVYRSCSPQNIADLFDHPNFEFGTRLAEALSNRLDNYLAQPPASSKPLLIAVITDGVPFPPPEQDMVCDVLVKATQRMKGKNDINVVFFQIGGRDRRGRDYLDFLDHDLVRSGAKYDVVKTITFEQLMADGLPRALANSAQHTAKLAR